MSPTSTEGDSVEVEAEPTRSVRANGEDPSDGESTVLAGTTESSGQTADDQPETAEFTAVEDETVVVDPAGAATEHETAETDEEPAEPDDEPVMVDELEETGFDHVSTPPEMSQMLFVDVVLLLPATHPVVVLQEADAPFRELRIPVGGAEGIAIGYAARGVATPRPLTHELFARVLEEFGMTIDVVRITEVRGSAFSAEMVVSGPMGTRVIDCRPSDAIALTLRQRLPAPIVAAPLVLAVAGTDPLGAN